MNNTKSGHKTPRLNPIPANTVVHTPTEAEAKELLVILHENGYKLWNGRNLLELSGVFTCQMNAIVIRPDQRQIDWYGSIANAPESITLAEFKRLYCEEEKPQPKFKVGDRVRVKNSKLKGVIKEPYSNDSGYRVYFEDGGGGWDEEYSEGDLEPYTKPETKPTEDMETKGKEPGVKGNNSENSQLNLCELLKGHEGKMMFLTTMGNVFLESISEKDIRFKTHETAKDIYLLNGSGKMNEKGVVIAYPSRALYEQYPLDPYKAWSVWQEEQKKFGLDIKIETYFEGKFGWEDCDDDVSCLHFRTPADRDKCIEEIKAIIEKYSKK